MNKTPNKNVVDIERNESGKFGKCTELEISVWKETE